MPVLFPRSDNSDGLHDFAELGPPRTAGLIFIVKENAFGFEALDCAADAYVMRKA
jgi:hypothetical protein